MHQVTQDEGQPDHQRYFDHSSKGKEFADAGLSSAQVSIESAISEEHDRITDKGSSGVY